MAHISENLVEFVLNRIKDGFIFENFAKSIISKLRELEFIPVGGIHDKGIDGYESVVSVLGRQNYIYQMSIEKDTKSKISSTIEKLHNNGINFVRFYYVTNQNVKDSLGLSEELSDKYNVTVQIWDQRWFKDHINDTQITIDMFNEFKSEYVFEFEQPGKSYEIIDMMADPQVFVFLRQQWDIAQNKTNLDEILAEALVLFVLEGTDPERGIVRTRSEIFELISKIVKFEPRWLSDAINSQIDKLSKKPLRRIKFDQRFDGYCLPFETRREIQNRNIDDMTLYENFKREAQAQLSITFSGFGISIDDAYKLFENVFHQLYKQQGLEFSNFVATGDGSLSIEKRLETIVRDVVVDHAIAGRKKRAVVVALIQTIRDTIYRGSTNQLSFLKKLSDTYRLLFLLQCDPKIAKYFASMATQMRIYVDTSIIIPAMSEYFLDGQNRRYSSLLTTAREAGVRLIVNDIIVIELASHLRNIKKTYYKKYFGLDEAYTDEMVILYVDDMLIRAYFYAKMKQQIKSFDEFVDAFVSPDMTDAEDELISWLHEAFGVIYEERTHLGLKIDTEEEETLYQALKPFKNSVNQARADARQLLTIYAIRELNNEHSIRGIYGYNTWWLTTDTYSQQAFESISNQSHKLRKNPYIRADFLYNHITLAPSRSQVDEIYKQVFPTVIGVNISYHVPQSICDTVQKYIKEHALQAGSPRLKGILRSLTTKIRDDPNLRDKRKLQLYLDSQRVTIPNKRGKSSE